MKRIVTIFLVVATVLLAGCGGFSQDDLDAKYDEGYDAGYAAYADPKNPGPAIGEAYDAGYEAARQEVEATLKGFGMTVDEALEYLSTTKPLRNPSYQELMDFLKRDDTNTTTESGRTDDFAKGLFRSAAREGFWPLNVVLYFPGNTYYLIAFKTIDRGLIYIDPCNDLPVEIKEGEHYSELNDLQPPPPWDDTIIMIVSFVPD